MLQVDLLWITAALLSSPLLTLCEPLNVLTAPNMLRVGTSENVFVEAQDYAREELSVRIFVMNFPQKNIQLFTTTTTLNSGNSYKALVAITIPENKDAFSNDPSEKQYVYLEAHFPTSLLEKVVLVSFQSGYIFIQTDKSIYTPSSTVNYRVFSMTPDLRPLDESVHVEITNPQQITIRRDLFTPTRGILTQQYDINELASSGTWSIAARYKSFPQKNFTAEFEVKEYVLPTFEVTLKPSKSFFYVDDEELSVDITAKYLIGQNVRGSAFVVFGVIQGDSKTSLTASLRRVTLSDGAGRATLTKQTIEKTFPNIHKMVGSSLYISVSVLTDTGSEMVEAQRRGIYIVKSPYTIHFKRTPKFFKPGLPFDVMVYVTNPDESPAEGVPVLISPENTQKKTTANGLVKAKVNTKLDDKNLQITAKTADPDISRDRQDEKNMTAYAYTTKEGSNNYLHIGINNEELNVGNHVDMNLNFNENSGVQNHDITYLFLSKGRIIKAEKKKRQGQTLLAISEEVTKDMLPSFRVVAYYHVGSSELVADSVWVDVKDRCMGKLNVKVMNAKGPYKPRTSFKLEVTGDPGASVGLVAVDKGIFVLNKNRLKQDKIWNTIEKHDIACTAGSGKDSMGVFYDAGLLFVSDKAGGTESRTTPDCPTPSKRRRRAESLLQITNTLTGKYSGELKKCCADGLRRNKLGYTCERRTMFITDGEECVKAFLHCCREMQTRRKEEGEDELHLARSEDEDFDESDDVTSRSHFPESWLWDMKQLPSCKGCHETNVVLENHLPDSITTWQILAVSLSQTHGICVADPYEMIVDKVFFVDLKLPYSAVRYEQLEIKAVLHNFSENDQTARVDLLETEHVCSSASGKRRYRTTVTIRAKSSRSISYIIIPMELKEHTIEVKAVTRDGFTDGIQKVLKVVAEGVLRRDMVINEELNPSKVSGGKQIVHVRNDVPKDQVPNTPAYTYVTVSGHEVSSTIEQAISGDFMGRLIIQPSGCGEQIMITMTLPLIAIHYLDATKQWERVGLDRRSDAAKHIKTGYDRELTYRKSDGSFSAFTDRASSTWLTAYVTKVFAMASSIITVQENVLCSALKWLIVKGQMPDGMFKEHAPVIHGEMVGDVQGKDAEASLTAFALIAMQEASQQCDELTTSLPESMKKAVTFLESKIPSLTNPYAVAMTSYAMANAGRFNKDLLMRHSSEGGAYWKASGGHHSSVEATAYAILALVKAKEFDAAKKAVHWLNRQTNNYGDSGTTQATIMVFQAVAEYYKQSKTLQNVNMTVKMSVSGRSKTNQWDFTRENSHLTHSEKVQLKKEFDVTAEGSGVGSLKVTTLYYARPIEKESDCKVFDLNVNMVHEAEDTYRLTIETFYKSETRDATMSILDIGLLTGFELDVNDIKELSTGVDRPIQKFEIDKKLSERGSLILYLDKIYGASNKIKIAFRMHKVNEVAMLQPAAVTVYEYYSPGDRCTKYYHPTKEDGTLSMLCIAEEDLCLCAEENCSIQKKQKISNEEERKKMACEVGIDYVYKVKVVSAELNSDTDFYNMKVEYVLKEGSDIGVEGKERSFMGHPNCRNSFGFEEGKQYLLMGRSADIPAINERYILGEHTWIESWPTDQDDENYKSLAAFNGTLSIVGCLT